MISWMRATRRLRSASSTVFSCFWVRSSISGLAYPWAFWVRVALEL